MWTGLRGSKRCLLLQKSNPHNNVDGRALSSYPLCCYLLRPWSYRYTQIPTINTRHWALALLASCYSSIEILGRTQHSALDPNFIPRPFLTNFYQRCLGVSHTSYARPELYHIVDVVDAHPESLRICTIGLFRHNSMPLFPPQTSSLVKTGMQDINSGGHSYSKLKTKCFQGKYAESMISSEPYALRRVSMQV